MSGDGDGWVVCAAGHRHWGRFGAAGLLISDGRRAILQHRAPWTHEGVPWALPGGARDSHEDPTSTALREAAEETGLDPSSVQILGTLPALALPGSGFLLTPVLAWSGRPAFTSSANLAEVSAMTTTPLRRQARHAPAEQLPGAWPGASANSPHGPLGAVTGVVIDLVTGMLARAANPPASMAVVDPDEGWPDRGGAGQPPADPAGAGRGTVSGTSCTWPADRVVT